MTDWAVITLDREEFQSLVADALDVSLDDERCVGGQVALEVDNGGRNSRGYEVELPRPGVDTFEFYLLHFRNLALTTVRVSLRRTESKVVKVMGGIFLRDVCV